VTGYRLDFFHFNTTFILLSNGYRVISLLCKSGRSVKLTSRLHVTQRSFLSRALFPRSTSWSRRGCGYNLITFNTEGAGIVVYLLIRVWNRSVRVSFSHPDRGFVWFSSIPLGKCRDVTPTRPRTDSTIHPYTHSTKRSPATEHIIK
jgi:hypothetical protein